MKVMPKKRFSAEQIVTLLRQIEVSMKNYTCSSNPCSQINGGSTDTIVGGVFGTEITYVPEPSSLAFFVAGLLALAGFGTMRRRKAIRSA
jgi:hypothetical protein